MKRRDFIAIAGAAVAWPFKARARQPDRSQNVGGLEEAKRHFDKISQPSEAARSDFITRVVRMREKAARQKTDEWKAIENEIRQHPAPKESDGEVLSGRRQMVIAAARLPIQRRRQLDNVAGRRGHDPWHMAHRRKSVFHNCQHRAV